MEQRATHAANDYAQRKQLSQKIYAHQNLCNNSGNERGREWYHRAMSAPLIKLSKASLSFDGRQVLHDVNLAIHEREIVTLIGPNGGGKSSVVRIVLGLQNTPSGEVRRRAGLRIGYMPQRMPLNPHMPLSVQTFLALDGSKAKAIRGALEDAGVADLASSPLQRISGGELQRVLFARALLKQPELLVLDEPAQGVDLAGQAELYQLIARARDELGCAVLMVSHDLNIVMANTDTVICLNRHVCCHGHPDHVSTHPEFLELFGDRVADTLAVYHHHHDHDHDVHGDVVCDHEH